MRGAALGTETYCYAATTQSAKRLTPSHRLTRLILPISPRSAATHSRVSVVTTSLSLATSLLIVWFGIFTISASTQRTASSRAKAYDIRLLRNRASVLRREPCILSARGDEQ